MKVTIRSTPSGCTRGVMSTSTTADALGVAASPSAMRAGDRDVDGHEEADASRVPNARSPRSRRADPVPLGPDGLAERERHRRAKPRAVVDERVVLAALAAEVDVGSGGERRHEAL